MVVVIDSIYYSEEQIYPWGKLAPGVYKTIDGCCAGCQDALKSGAPLLEGHFACSNEAFEAKAVIIDEQLIDGEWKALIRED